MKTHKIRSTIVYCILTTGWILFVLWTFTGCHVYEHEELETILCPRIDADTVAIPDWESESNFSNF